MALKSPNNGQIMGKYGDLRLRHGATVGAQLQLERLVIDDLSTGVDEDDVLVVRGSILHVGERPRDKLGFSEGQGRKGESKLAEGSRNELMGPDVNHRAGMRGED